MTFKQFKDIYQKAPVQEVSASTPKNPTVSVLVQTYRQKDFIKDCLDSILMQITTFDFEILIGEDESKDGTREICLEYAKKYSDKIKLFLHQRENQIKVLGEATSNFNAFYNFYSARGKYVAFCEGDDYWQDPYKLQKQVDIIEKFPGFILSYHKFVEKNIYYKHNKKINALIQPEQDLNRSDLSKLKFHPLLSTVCFRNCLNELPEEMIKVINVDSFLLSILGTKGMAKYQPEIKPSVYRKHAGGIWSHSIKEKKFLSKINTFKNLSIYYRAEKNLTLFNNFEAQLLYSYKMLGIFYLKRGQILKAVRNLAKMVGEKLSINFVNSTL